MSAKKKKNAEQPSAEQNAPAEQQKEKKVKVIYYDDGSTVADMSGTRKEKTPRQKATFKEQARTFFTVMKKMVIPMLATLAALTLVYIIILAAAGKL